jgi:NTE family protein
MSPAKFKKCETGAEQSLPAATAHPSRKPAADGSHPSFGLALGGGGARGLCHALMLEALDELGIRPALIAGTSIGALMGAAYASGMSGAEIQEYIRDLFQNRTQLVTRLFSQVNRRGVSQLFKGSALPLSGERILKALLPETIPATFEELKIPFIAVTTDFFTQDQHAVSEGPLIPAIAASAALPGILKPIDIGRILVDGGFVNPLPFDLLKDRVDVVAAIDVSAEPRQTDQRLPALLETVIGSLHIALATIVREKLRSGAPDILIRPDVGQFRVLEFYKFEEIFAASRPAKDEFKRACEKALGRGQSTQA